MEAIDELARAPIFANLERVVLSELARSAKVRRFSPGEVLVREGEEAVAFFMLYSGEAEVVKNVGQGQERVVGHLSAGDFFGEMALMDGFPRSASVKAVSPCECLVLVRWDFLAVVRTSPDVAFAILSVLSRRLRELDERLQQ